jgi:hypothetical protein
VEPAGNQGAVIQTARERARALLRQGEGLYGTRPRPTRLGPESPTLRLRRIGCPELWEVRDPTEASSVELWENDTAWER